MRTAAVCGIALLSLLAAGCGLLNSSKASASRAAESSAAKPEAAPAPRADSSSRPATTDITGVQPQQQPPPPPALSATPQPVAPRTSPPPQDPVPGNSKDRIKTRDRYINVKAKCEAAEDAFDQIKRDSTAGGGAPHPDIVNAYRRMKAALQSAQRELDAGEEANARESLDLAEVSAAKVLRAGGGN